MEKSKKTDSEIQDVTQVRIGRRRLLETMTVAGGALAASALIPDRWVKPVAKLGALPAHAQTSPVLGTGDLQVTVTWDTDDTDVDTFVIEPDGTVVWWGMMQGPTATLDYDNTEGFGPENVFVPAGDAADGVYHVYVGYYSGEVPTTVTIRITTFDGTPQQQQQTFTRELVTADGNDTVFAVADITFPAGTIVEQCGAIPHPMGVLAAAGQKD